MTPVVTGGGLNMTLNTQDEYKIRKEDIELYKRIRREVEQEFMAKYEPVDYRSVTKIDFHKDVVRVPPRPEPMLHEMVKEQPVTFWTEHRDKMHFRLFLNSFFFHLLYSLTSIEKHFLITSKS
ncbi:unnamed protein product [Schistosoma margrebowiei]|uniref:Uncharacterized protein n=1 Tax=Schistosoma margrebowiei TaxID=48269 RepID=A0AA84ZQ14_9TREM|nr:unnamed protein product [Schistosoma margrebowiei]